MTCADTTTFVSAEIPGHVPTCEPSTLVGPLAPVRRHGCVTRIPDLNSLPHLAGEERASELVRMALNEMAAFDRNFP